MPIDDATFTLAELAWVTLRVEAALLSCGSSAERDQTGLRMPASASTRLSSSRSFHGFLKMP